MTPTFAYFIVCGFVSFLIVGAVILEQTAVGRRFAQRAEDWIVGTRRITR